MNIVTLEVLLKHFYCAYPWEEINDSHSTQDAVDFLVRNDMIYQIDDDKFRITDRGKFYVEHLTRIPLPEPTFVIPKEKICHT